MCEIIREKKLIKVDERTRKHKYKLLDQYIPMWNSILVRKGVKRAIVDTHAGTGLVFDSSKEKEIYGSPFIFLIKTILANDNLVYYFIEQKQENYDKLCRNIESSRDKPFKIKTKKSRKKKKEEEIIKKYGGLKVFKKISPPPRIGYINKDLINIECGNCLKIVPKILSKIQDRVTLFFIDPCGALDWNLVDTILNERLLKDGTPGTELIINWSWWAILRNPHNPEVISKIYGKDYELIDNRVKELKKEGYYKWESYFMVYKEKFNDFFEYIHHIPVPFKQWRRPSYILMFCSNNESADSLIKSAMKRIKIPDWNLLRFLKKPITSFLKDK